MNTVPLLLVLLLVAQILGEDEAQLEDPERRIDAGHCIQIRNPDDNKTRVDVQLVGVHNLLDGRVIQHQCQIVSPCDVILLRTYVPSDTYVHMCNEARMYVRTYARIQDVTE